MAKKVLSVAIVCALAAFVVYAIAVNIRSSDAEQQVDIASAQQPTSASAAFAALQVEGAGAGMDAIRNAAAEGKYTFAFFYKDEDEGTLEMRQLFEKTMEKVTDRAEYVCLDASDPSEKDIVKTYAVDGSPMPLVLAIAPNGALTRGLPRRFSEKELLDSFASPCMENCLLGVQKTRLVALCVQSASTEFNAEATEAVRALMADPRFTKMTDLVTLDPSDPDEATTCKRFGIDPKTDQAVTLLLAPPGRIIGRFKGNTSKDEMIATLNRATSGGCGTGCAPGSCGK